VEDGGVGAEFSVGDGGAPIRVGVAASAEIQATEGCRRADTGEAVVGRFPDEVPQGDAPHPSMEHVRIGHHDLSLKTGNPELGKVFVQKCFLVNKKVFLENFVFCFFDKMQRAVQKRCAASRSDFFRAPEKIPCADRSPVTTGPKNRHRAQEFTEMKKNRNPKDERNEEEEDAVQRRDRSDVREAGA
jgi:hypothetical protein